MDIDGISVAQVATEAFEAGLAEAISAETGDYTDETSSVVVRGRTNVSVGRASHTKHHDSICIISPIMFSSVK